MGSYSPEDVEDLKNKLCASVRKVSELYGVNDRLVELLRDKTIQTGEARRRIEDMETRDVGKTKTIRQLKKRLKKRDP